MKKSNERVYIILTIILTLLIFIVGLFAPLGIASAVPYTFVVLLTIWIPGNNYTYVTAIITTILTIAGIYLAPDPIIVWTVVITNRTISVIGIWAAVFIVLRQKKIEASKKEKEETIRIAKEELELYSKALEISNNDLEQFAYVASHDLQEPLRKIQSFGERLKSKDADNLSEQGKDYVNRMNNAASRMQNLINDLLLISRISTTSQKFIQVDLNKIFNEVISDLEVTIEKNQVKIEKENLPTIEADPTQIRQLFQNLISNSIKFRKEEPPVVKIYSKKLNEHFIQLFFEDKGIGFDEKYLGKIFTIFQRLEGQKYEGSGIGLSVCKKIVQRHEGDITAKSQIGEGTTFIITLPVHQKSNYSHSKN